MNARFLLMIAALAVWSGCFRAAAADVSADFTTANKMYAEGKFAEAAGAYEQIIESTSRDGTASPALYFNAGNAEFKLGHLGRAIAAYRRAAWLNPRDSEVLGNLGFARNQVQGATVRPAAWQNLFGVLTLNEGTLLTAGALWLWLGLLSIRQLKPALTPQLRGLTLAALVAVILSSAVLAVQATSRFTTQTAVVTTGNVLARVGPFDDAQTVFSPHDGAELTVLDRHDDWLQVTDGSGKIGWLPRKVVELLPGA
jgi:tetratricopeptide (TPR) repeat protein